MYVRSTYLRTYHMGYVRTCVRSLFSFRTQTCHVRAYGARSVITYVRTCHFRANVCTYASFCSQLRVGPAAAMDEHDDFGAYLGLLSSSTCKKRKKTEQGDRRARRNSNQTIIEKFSLGEQVLRYCATVHGKDYAENLFAGQIVKMPNGFWPGFLQENQNLAYTTTQRLKHYRALQFFIQCKRAGNMSTVAMLQGEKRSAMRSSGGSCNAAKCPALGHQVLQYFVDFVQVLSSRADSRLLLEYARQCRANLLASGFLDSELPQLGVNGNAGAWLHHMEGSSKQNTFFYRSGTLLSSRCCIGLHGSMNCQ